MDFRMIKKWQVSLLVLGLLSGCSGDITLDLDEHQIGEKLGDVSAPSISARDAGANTRKISIFDKTTRKIHLFELGRMRHVKTFSVSSPKDEHFVLSPSNGGYVIDLSLKRVSVITAGGMEQPEALRFVGQPNSAAYDPDRGVLVVYDDMMSVGLLRISETGLLLNQSWVGGPLLNGEAISAGDLDRRTGELLLISKEGSLRVVDIDRSIQDKAWTFATLTVPLTRANWLAPVPGTSQVLLRSPEKVVLYDRQSGQVLDEVGLGSARTEKLSKRGWPHLLVRADKELRMIYPENGKLVARSLYGEAERIVVSDLDPELDQWAFVTSTSSRILNGFGEMDREGEKRFRRFRLSDMAALDLRNLSAKAQIRLGPDYVFSLFPSELGLAERSSFDGTDVKRIEAFNVPYL